MLSLCLFLVALLKSGFAATVTEIRAKTTSNGGAPSAVATSFQVWFEGTVYGCGFIPNRANWEFSCTPQAVGKDCDSIGDYPQIKVINNHVDASVFDWIQFTTSAGTKYTATGFCADATVRAQMLNWMDANVPSGTCSDGDSAYYGLCTDIDHCGVTEWVFEFPSTTVKEASLELGAGVTFDPLTTNCGCGEFGAKYGHVCSCQSGGCGQGYCNSVGFVAKKLNVVSTGATCDATETCCCSCPNCQPFIEPVS